MQTISKNPRPGITLMCFTPLVTLSTFFIELVLSVYTFYTYRKTLFGRLSALFLLLLGIFQLSEFLICNGDQSYFWTRLGWISITFLPPIGLHLVSLFTKKTTLVPIGYAIATLFSTIFALDPDLFTEISCAVTYVRFISFYNDFNILYKIFYFVFLAIAIGLMASAYKKAKHKDLIAWFVLAYASFIVPTAIIYLFVLAPGEAFPSIFCGFAIFLAIIAVGKVIPLYHKYFPNKS